MIIMYQQIDKLLILVISLASFILYLLLWNNITLKTKISHEV